MPLWPPLLYSIPSMALCPLYGSLLHLRPFVPTMPYFPSVALFPHDYRLSEKCYDNRNNHIQQKAITEFREKLKMPFRINPNVRSQSKECTWVIHISTRECGQGAGARAGNLWGCEPGPPAKPNLVFYWPAAGTLFPSFSYDTNW